MYKPWLIYRVVSVVERIEREERRERKETRITRDVRAFVGWKYIEKIIELSPRPIIPIAIFLTGGRAQEVLMLRREMFAEFDDYYEVVGMPVLKRFDVIGKYIDPDGKRRWRTELRMERRTFPILKIEPYSDWLWKYSQDSKDLLFEFKGFKDQYWQLYNIIRKTKHPPNPYAPKKNLYPHWLRGQRAAQLRVEYGLDIDELMRFFGWKSFKTAQHYAGMSSRDLADSMMQGRRVKVIEPMSEPLEIKLEPVEKKEVPKKKSTYELFKELRNQN